MQTLVAYRQLLSDNSFHNDVFCNIVYIITCVDAVDILAPAAPKTIYSRGHCAGMASIEWEPVESVHGPGQRQDAAQPATMRARIPGGWLVAILSPGRFDGNWPSGVTFVPDPNHTWN